jgi:hypothetical protein
VRAVHVFECEEATSRDLSVLRNGREEIAPQERKNEKHRLSDSIELATTAWAEGDEWREANASSILFEVQYDCTAQSVHGEAHPNCLYGHVVTSGALARSTAVAARAQSQ